MNIQEAINSDRPFKLPHHRTWMTVVDNRVQFNGVNWVPPADDLAADDYEIQEPQLGVGALIQIHVPIFNQPHILTGNGFLVNTETGAVWKYRGTHVPLSVSELKKYIGSDFTIIRREYA